MKPYLFTLPESHQYSTGMRINTPVLFEDGGHLWLMIDTEGVMTIAANYAWDGCSPKYLLFGRVIGTPDGPIDPETKLPKTYWASLVHDVLCQFAEHKDMPWTRAEIDQIFYEILIRDRFSLADQYYWAVTTLGPIHKWLEQRLLKFTARYKS